MKIALTLLSGVGYGGLTYFQNLIPALAAADHENEYHLFVSQGHPLIKAVEQKNFVFHECVGNNQSALKRFLWEQLVLPWELKRYKVDILFTAKNLNVFWASCKTVISGRNMEPLAYREYDNDWKLNIILRLKWQLTKWSVHKADHIVAVSQAVKDRLLEKFPGIEKKITVVYNGNPVPIAPTPPNLPSGRGGKTLSPPLGGGDSEGVQSPFLLIVSKFVAYANQLNLLKGYARLVEKNPDTPPLWFAGGVHDKKYFKNVQNFVDDNKLGKQVKFLGLVAHDKLLELMRGAQVFVFPSTLESCPHTLIEAMACGVPIAASNIQPMLEICADAAIYFDPYDPGHIVSVIKSVLDSEVLRNRLCNQGLARAQYFTWGKTAHGLIKVFERV